MTGRHVLYVRYLTGPPVPDRTAPADRAAHPSYPGLLGVLHGITPVVQALPPDAALADVRGALRYFGLDAVRLARLVRVRGLALHGTDCAIGVAPNPLLARLAAARPGGGPGVTAVPGDPDALAAFLADRPPADLHGIGPATARALAAYGIDTVGRLAAAPPLTLQRILGASAARRVQALARGIDPTPVVPGTPAASVAAEHRFGHDELDPAVRRRALLTLADRIGYRLRDAGRTARALTLTVRYADRSATTRRRTLAEPTAHTPALTGAAYALHDALGLQRARVRSVALRAEDLADAADSARQLSLDPADERRRRAEAAADRARHRFGPRAATPAAHLDAA